MTVGRLVAIIFIFSCVTIAWIILGSSIHVRTESGYGKLGEQVELLWGGEHVQEAPLIHVSGQNKTTTSVEPSSSDIDVSLHLQHRRKGLLWYPTYEVAFDGNYTFENPLNEPVTATVAFVFPSSNAIYDDFSFRVNDEQAKPGRGNNGNLTIKVPLEAGETATIHAAYKSRGMNRWLYRFSEGITTVSDFVLTVHTDFGGFDFPARTISPSLKERTPDGWLLRWQFTNLVSDFDVGVDMPQRLNPGPLASRMSYFAPISLLFFFTVLVVLGAIRGTNLHPMHYFFLGAAFFAFHLLFAYLVDHLIPEISFVIAALVSLGLVISYLWRAVGPRFALREAAISQFLFLVLFSYAFFFEGYTGLVVTVGAILTLAALMQITARVDWGEVFQKKDKPKPAPSA